MLAALLSSQYARFAALADAWLAMGASAFGIYQEDRPLLYWPSGQKLAQPSLAMPIMLGEQIVGDLRVAGINDTASFARLKADASMVTYMLTLEDELQSMTADLVTSQDQQLALYRLTQSMQHLITIDETLSSLVAEAMRMVKSRAGFAMFVPPGKQEPRLVQQPANYLDPALAWGYYWQAQATEQEIVLPSDDAELSIPGIHSLLFVPIRVRGTIMAGIGVANKIGKGFEMPDVKLARAIASQASAQIEKVLLYQETFEQTRLRTEMDLARRVQMDLLPRQLPRISGLDIYAYSRPALQIGGDFYDFIVSEARPFIFSVGDVTGKGLPAALLMTMTRSAIHSKAQFMPSPTPEAVMRQSHEDLYTDFTQVGVFATAFVGQYTPGSHKLLYANAGHSPVIYRPRNGSAQLLRADSTAIGILSVSHCRNHVVDMRPDDLLIVATDGFSDARNLYEEMFNHERLLALVDQLADKPAQEIANGLFNAVNEFGDGRPQDDDQTLVIVKGVAG